MLSSPIFRHIEIIFMAIVSYAMCTEHVVYAAEAFPEAIDTAQTKTRALNEEFTKSLMLIDIKQISADEEKAVIFFVRGLTALSSEPNEAADNFAAAQKLLPPESALKQLVSIYAGRASVQPKNARHILGRLKIDVSKSQRRPSLWKPEQFSLLLDVMIALKQDTSLTKVWTEMESRVRPALRPEEMTAKVARYIEQRPASTLKSLIPIIESMAATYPHSENGRWAFHKLQSLMCDHRASYVFSQALISRLASNTNLDEGLKHYLIEMSRGPMRTTNGSKIVLDSMDRISFLIQIRMWNEARRLIEDEVSSLRGAMSTANKIKLARLLMQLGTVQAKQGDHDAAAQTWSRYLRDFGEVTDWRVAYEGLADALARLRLHSVAATMYELLAKSPSADPVLRWHHFWNLYLARDYQAALALLDRGGYVPQRDRGIDGGLDYWRARILEKLGKSKEAEQYYRNVVLEAGDTFYAVLVQAKKTNLVESTKSQEFATHDISKDSPAERNGAGTNSALNIDDGSLANADQTEIKSVIALRKWGQLQVARRIHRLLPLARSKNGHQNWIDSFRLALELKDYSYGFKAPAMPESPLKAIPSAVKPLVDHMSRYNVDWKLMYPFAFRDIVDPMAQAAGVDPFLVLSIMRAESAYDPDARSVVGARGLMQIMPFTAIRIARMMLHPSFSLGDLHRAEVNIGYGAFYIKKLMDYYGGNPMLAVAAYNGGPTSVDRWLSQYGDLEIDELIESMSFRETRRYVKTVFRNYDNYKRIWQQAKAITALPDVPKSGSGEEIF
jgi:soluble lytic murein transglycosylase-like protein